MRSRPGTLALLVMPADSSAAPWQNTALALEINSPLREPSAEVLAKPPVWLPSSSFIPDYSDASGAGPTKVIMERGEPRLVTALPQGFSGSGFERYPSGETYVGDFCNGRRHGRGTYTDFEGPLVSHFEGGMPRREGAKVLGAADGSGGGGLHAAMRTHEGKTDGLISIDEAGRIASNIGMKLPASPDGGGIHSAAARTPPHASSKIASRLDPATSTRGAGAAKGAAGRRPSAAGADGSAAHGTDFLSRLEALEIALEIESLTDDAHLPNWVIAWDQTPPAAGSHAQAEGAARQIQASYRRHSTLSGAEGAAAVVAQASGGSHGASPAEDRGGGAVIKAGRKTPKSAAARRKQREMAGANGNLSAAGRRPRKARAPETLPS